MKKILDHVIATIHATPLKNVPGSTYYYLDIDNIWPEEFYTELVERMPTSLRGYTPLSSMYSDRYRYELGHGENVDLNISKLEIFGADDKAFWTEFQQHFIQDQTLAHTIMEKNGEYLAYDYTTKRWKINCRLCKDLSGYSIGVHSDRKDKIFSCIFYTPKEYSESKRQDWGTQILVAKDPKMPPNAEVHHQYNSDGSSDLFDLYHWVECRPNSMFSWCVTPDSYHGVPPVKTPGYRDTIQLFAKCNNKNRKLYGE